MKRREDQRRPTTLRLSSVWIGEPGTCALSLRLRHRCARKLHLGTYPRSHRPMGDRAGQALPSWEDRPSVWSKPKGPSSPLSWLIPSSCFTRSTRRPRPATARPLRPAGPRAIPPMPRSASSCFSTTAPNSLPGSQTILRRAGVECEQYRPAPVLAGVEYQASLFRCTRGIHQCADVSYGEDVLCCFVVIGQCLDRGAWARGDIHCVMHQGSVIAGRKGGLEGVPRRYDPWLFPARLVRKKLCSRFAHSLPRTPATMSH